MFCPNDGTRLPEGTRGLSYLRISVPHSREEMLSLWDIESTRSSLLSRMRLPSQRSPKEAGDTTSAATIGQSPTAASTAETAAEYNNSSEHRYELNQFFVLFR
jgi:hypothetical protein